MAQLVAVDIDKSIGQRIQQRRRELGYSADRLSEMIGISQQQLSRYERGANKINVSHLVSIATCLKTPISWFFLDCEPQFESYSPQPLETLALPIRGDDLKMRLDQHWQALSDEQRKKLISFLDSVLSMKN
ncbi:helix-turn-helix domain-containing protein [Basilea psittacipulmonis]|uniref:HTH cro/C1-type domain-containing protein n=1 Tax=Basilea psittacipulmonis DSM 24701 TaxID=1072685 RepID=A0A077DE61_9BURK|nr:helix-turn-helix transcriptional regulator [Basilea psittacipulmonis]AIL32431.1 hypothetical protein IX83_03100 [Basilea psittacipulmonis DSM 24701]